MFRRKDGKYLIYIPLDLANDSMFPFKNYTRSKRGTDSVPVKVRFKIGETDKLLIEKWEEQNNPTA